MVEKIIGVSTACFYYWVDQGKWISEQLQVIDIISTYVRRVELQFSVQDILNFSGDLFENYKNKLKNLSCSFHLPDLSGEEYRLDDICYKIELLVNELNIEYCVAHADDFAKLKKINKSLPWGIHFGLENSDERKIGFQHLKDLGIFSPIPVVVDIDHLMEMELNLKRELADLRNQIVGIHWSTPQNEFYKNYPYVNTTHYLFAKSGKTPPKELPKEIPIVIEGVVPKSRTSLLQEEIRLIKKILS